MDTNETGAKVKSWPERRSPRQGERVPTPTVRQEVPADGFLFVSSDGSRWYRRCFGWVPLVLLGFGVALGLSGCAGYTLGPTNGLGAGEKSVQIQPFANLTLEPRLTDAVTSQLRKELQRDGTYQLATHGNGDIIVSGALTRYQRLEVTFAPADVLTVQDYRLMLTARVTARERATGNVILRDVPVSGYTLIRVGSDLPSAERQALPMLARDLARNVTALLAEGSW